MINPTYKHLESRLRLGAFTLGQWAQIAGAGVSAALFGVYISPLPTTVTIFVSIIVAGLPVAMSYGAMGLEFSVGGFLGSAWRYWRRARHYLPGAGETATGYVVDAVPARQATDVEDQRTATPSPEGTLWDL